jgi:hypothetical protein
VRARHDIKPRYRFIRIDEDQLVHCREATMNIDKKDFKTIQQIDGTGIHSPHDGELKTIAEAVKESLPKISRNAIETAMQQAGGSLDTIGFGEDFTMNFEFFPGVRIHVVYFAPGTGADEMENEPDVKFLFSGDAVSLVSSEDLASLVDLSMDYLRDLAMDDARFPVVDVISELLQRSISQRVEPFAYVQGDEMLELAAFIGGSITTTSNGWQLYKIFFPGIAITLNYEENNILFDFSGDNIERINIHARDQLAIFMLNHCLRFIGTRHASKDMPRIVDMAFSFSYLRSRPDA